MGVPPIGSMGAIMSVCRPPIPGAGRVRLLMTNPFPTARPGRRSGDGGSEMNDARSSTRHRSEAAALAAPNADGGTGPDRSGAEPDPAAGPEPISIPEVRRSTIGDDGTIGSETRRLRTPMQFDGTRPEPPRGDRRCDVGAARRACDMRRELTHDRHQCRGRPVPDTEPALGGAPRTA